MALLVSAALAQDEEDPNARIRRLRFRRPRPRVLGVSDEEGQRGAPIPLRAAAGKKLYLNLIITVSHPRE